MQMKFGKVQVTARIWMQETAGIWMQETALLRCKKVYLRGFNIILLLFEMAILCS